METQELIRIGAFVASLALFLLLSLRWPLRVAAAGRLRRARDNLVLLLVGAVIVRLMAPVSALAAAFLAQQHGFGLLHWLDLRLSLAFLAALLLLDLGMYAQHVALHAWMPLWRLHRVHHSDTDLDATTGVRFHPAEIALSVIYKAVVVALIGAPPAAVIAFEIVLNACSLFNHSNLALPRRFERALRRVLVTPAMHWVHHSIEARESQHNFGFCLSGWDRLFGTYQEDPAAGLEAMQLGVAGFEARAAGIGTLLAQPLAAEGADARAYVLRARR